MLSWKNINSIKVENEKRLERKAAQRNELTMPSDSLLMLAETTTDDYHHVSDE